MAGEQIFTVCATNSAGDILSPSVNVWVTKIDDNLAKPLMEFPIPRSKDTSGSNNKLDGTAGKHIIDIGTVNQAINIQGFLYDESTEAAQEKKDNLLDLFKNYRKIKMYWGTGSRLQSLNGNLSKCMITEIPGIVGNAQKTGYESEKNFAVQLSLIVGTDK